MIVIKAFASLATCTLLAQTVPAPDLGIAPQIERLGLTGTLIVGIIVLGKMYLAKDKQVTDANTAVTAALTTAAETARQAAASNERLHEAITELRESLGKLPCTDVSRVAARAGRS